MTNELLTKDEADRMLSLESAIEQGVKTFVEVGAALMEIRESRLYRVSHKTFEAYCKERWDMSKTNANRLIGSATVVENLAPIGVKPQSEAQARPLTALEPEDQVEVWGEVVEKAKEEDRPVTAKDVTRAVKERTKPTEKAEPKPTGALPKGFCNRKEMDTVSDIVFRLQSTASVIRKQFKGWHKSNKERVMDAASEVQAALGRE